MSAEYWCTGVVLLSGDEEERENRQVWGFPGKCKSEQLGFVCVYIQLVLALGYRFDAERETDKLHISVLF